MSSVRVRCCIVLLGFLAGAVGATAQGLTIPSGAAIYIEEMDNDLDGYIRAEFMKQKVPLVVVLSREQAHLVLTGTSTPERKVAWHEGWLTQEQDRTTGNIMVFDRSTRKLLWAGEAGDRSVFFGSLVRGGQRKVASRAVKSLKKAMYLNKEPLPAPPPLTAEEAALAKSADPSTVAPGAPEGRVIKPKGPALTNDDIVQMSKAGLADDVIIKTIESSTTRFSVTPGDLIALKNAGVSERVLAALIEAAKRQ